MTNHNGKLRGKTALVTGASRGIGRAIAKALAAEGADVAINFRSTDEAREAGDVVDEIHNVGGCARTVMGDVADEGQVLAMFSGCDKVWKHLDIVVNNAGVIFEKELVETEMTEFDWLMGINLRGAFMVGREALRRMQVQPHGGRLINVASDLAFLGREQFSVYCASKGAILSLTRSWAREFAPNVLVNAIAPGPTQTAMLGLESMTTEWRRKEEDNPMRRVGWPEEIASAAVFLAGPDASFMVGQIIGPNGGSAMP
jgi:3-oxoacyl-[acyl-carrier protein] reductase